MLNWFFIQFSLLFKVRNKVQLLTPPGVQPLGFSNAQTIPLPGVQPLNQPLYAVQKLPLTGNQTLPGNQVLPLTGTQPLPLPGSQA